MSDDTDKLGNLVDRLNEALCSDAPGFGVRQEIERACGYSVGEEFDLVYAAMNRLGLDLRVVIREDK